MLTGPELDLLLEVLEEDPTADVYLDVANTLMERGDARDAARVLRRAVQHGATDHAAAHLLARAASESGDHAGVKAAGDVLGEAVMLADRVLARAYALGLDQAGELERAGDIAQRLLAQGVEDDELRAVVDRQHAPPPDPRVRARDPHYSVSRAEAYLENGRPDLAIRVYRRILAANPDRPAVHARLLRLSAMPREPRPWVDDLSEEYWVNRSEPQAALNVPTPRLVPTQPPQPDDEQTQPGAPAREVSASSAPARSLRPPPIAATPPSIRRVANQGPTLTPADETPVPTRSEKPPVARRPVVDDDEATVVMGRKGSGVFDIFADDDDDADEEETAILSRGPVGPPRLGPADRPTIPGAPRRRTLPGLDELRAAIDADRHIEDLAAGEDSDEDIDALPVSPDGSIDTDAIIEQAKAIERAAAERRRRSLLRK